MVIDSPSKAAVGRIKLSFLACHIVLYNDKSIGVESGTAASQKVSQVSVCEMTYHLRQ